jgi:serine/threonine protein kinase
MNKLNILTMKFFIYQIFQSLLFLKEHLLVHCDIKLDNYLLFNYFILKLSDFSCMRLLNLNDDLQLKSTTWNIKGKEYFTNDKKVNFSNAFKVDIYCTGAMIYKLRYNNYIIDKKLKEFFINEKISPEEKIDKIEKQIKNAIVLIKNDNVNEDFKKLLISMIECDINDRPNIENLLNDKWINEDHEIINKIKSINETEEIKIFLEFEKHKIIKRKRKKFTFNKK